MKMLNSSTLLPILLNVKHSIYGLHIPKFIQPIFMEAQDELHRGGILFQSENLIGDVNTRLSLI